MSAYIKEYGLNILIYDCCSEELTQLIATLENEFDITCAVDGDDDYVCRPINCTKWIDNIKLLLCATI